MRKIKLISVIMSAILLVSVSGLAGCGSRRKNDGSISFFISAQAHEQAAIEKLLAKYTQKTGTVVNLNVVTAESDSYWTKLKSYASAKQLPDVFYMGPGQLDYYLNKNQLFDITTHIENNAEYDYEDLYPELRARYLVGDSIYGVPSSFSVYLMGYNRVIIDQIIDSGRWPSDILYPWDIDPKTGEQVVYTWDEFSRASAACTVEPDYYGTGLLERWAFHSWIWGAGADWLSADKKTVTITTPEFKKAMNEFYALHRTRGAVQDAASEGAMNHYQRWLNGQIAFFNVGTWDVGGFDKLAAAKMNYGVMPCPKMGEDSTWYTYNSFNGYSVAKESLYPDKAVDLILYLTTSQDAYDVLVKEDKIMMPSTMSKKDAYALDPDITPVGKELFLSAIEDGHVKALPVTYTYNSEWYDTFYSNTGDMWGVAGRAPKYTPDQFLEYIQPIMQEKLDRAVTQQQQDASRK
jgi:multiple sugar transport system substrate-binding protein